MLTLTVPPGIGDISWVYSKVADLATRRKVAFQICDNPPARALEYVSLLPNITNLGYTGGSFPNMKGRKLALNEDIESLPDGEYSAFMNVFLENGIKLADIFPNQKTNYHYDLNLPNKGGSFLEQMKGKKVGFYASSTMHRPEFSFWNSREWATFMGTIAELIPCHLIALGASFDNRTMEAYGILNHNKAKIVNAVGLTDIGTTIEIIKGLDFFFAFPSGLGILADVVNTPCQMFYWNGEKTKQFINSYADPENIASGRHTNLLYCSMGEALKFFMENGKKFL